MPWRPCCCGTNCCGGATSGWPGTFFMTVSMPARPDWDGTVFTLTLAGTNFWSSGNINESSHYYPGDIVNMNASFSCDNPGGFSGGIGASVTVPIDGRDRCYFKATRIASVDCATKTIVIEGNMGDAADGNPCASHDPFTLTITP